MNYLDELLGLYAGRDWTTQRYFLTHLSSLPPGLESDALLEFLWGEAASPRTPLRHMARRQLGRVLPACLRQAYGLQAAKLGVWTAYAQGPAAAAAARAPEIPGDTYERLLAAAWHKLSGPLARTLELLAGESPRARVAASLVAGRIHTKSGMEALKAGVAANRKLSFPHAAALADLGGAEAHEKLLELGRTVGARVPDLLMLLAEVPAEKSVAVLSPAELRADAIGATAIALALAGDPAGGREVLVRLIKRGDPWVIAYALDALTHSPGKEDLELARTVHERAKQEFLQVLAVKLAGAVPGPEPVAFLSEALAQGAPRVKAAALESLARKRVEPESLARAAAEHAGSPLLKLKVNALLVLARRDPAAAMTHVDAMLASDDAVQRVEAAYVLGYLRAPAAAGILGELASTDPRGPVRIQAVKSLAKQDPDAAIPRLVAASAGSQARPAALAARALAALPEDAMPRAVAALAEAARGAHGAAKGVLLRALGIAASRASSVGEVPPGLEAGLSDGQDAVLLGALEGAKCLGRAPGVERQLAHADARVRYRAAVAAFLSGRLEAVDALDALLAAPEEDTRLKGLQGLLELAILLPCAVAAPHFAPLRAALDPVSNQTAARTYTAKEQPRAPVEPERPAARTPPAAARWESVPVELPGRKVPAPRTPPRPGASGSVSRKSLGADQPLRREQVEGTTYLAGLPAGQAGWAEWLRAYRPLVAAAAVLMVPLLIVLINWRSAASAAASTGGGGPPPPGSLRVTALSGKATSGPAGKPGKELALRAVVAPGEKVATQAGARVILSDGRHNAVSLGETSQLVLGVRERDAADKAKAAYVFTEPEGDLLIDFRKVDVEGRKAIEVALAKERLSGASFTVRIRDTGTDRAVTLVSGDVELAGDGPPRKLQPAETVNLKVPAP